MLINELPNDCLLIIFDQMNYLGDLINCSKVCIKWNHLVVKRTKKVKYFMEDPDYSSDYVYYRGRGPFDVTCLSTLFPNLKIAEFSHKMERKVEFEDIVAFVKNHESLKGLLLGYFFTRPIEEHCDKLEMLSVDTLDPSIIQNGSSIKQLYILICTLDDFKRDAHHFPNLERLHIVSNEAPYSYYDGPVLEKLKIVELGFTFTYDTDICYGFHFMDSCPNLQSAHIFLDSHRFFVDETIKHKCLQDLVIDFGGPSRINWNDLKRLLMKYPNLKHLGLRGARNIKDEHIKQLVHILPNLVLFQVTVCEEITQSAAGYIKDYCEKYGRSIKFYFDENFSEIESDWPQLSTKQEKISRGFDFMKHCFLKFIHRVPNFLIPIDY
ncbi:uncharacterized protein LOC107361803 isoform X3 [Tetranychus urticae]|uniref:F-box domain-containing protein n=1 Tax=Tetranychus urticae TaxID=32264 RepID=A0A158P4Q6_TETUR|nr:uncharacterized protein LOC107361803 isoform X3 [Tetranychus urticae]